ncbi:hypothetical protein BDZ89DRAFT_1047606 [Hymenopellis radicata]|nr:hypothetical protein BDZ89DRAFT_1047606 [Hymenopellis radicata]
MSPTSNVPLVCCISAHFQAFVVSETRMIGFRIWVSIRRLCPVRPLRVHTVRGIDGLACDEDRSSIRPAFGFGFLVAFAVSCRRLQTGFAKAEPESSSSICPDPGSEFAEGCSHGDEQRLTRRDFDMTGRKQEGPSITSMPDEAVRRSPPAIICKNVKLEDDAFRSTLKVRFRRGTTCASTGTTISETWTPWMPSPGRLESGGKTIITTCSVISSSGRSTWGFQDALISNFQMDRKRNLEGTAWGVLAGPAFFLVKWCVFDLALIFGSIAPELCALRFLGKRRGGCAASRHATDDIYEIPYAMVVLSRLDEEAAAPPP